LNKIIIIIYNKKNMSVFNQTTQSFGSNNTTLNDVMMSGDLCIGGNLHVGGDVSSNNNFTVGSFLQGGTDGVFSQPQTINVTTVSTTQEYSIGTQYKTGKNTYRYASFPTGSAVTPGIVLQGPAIADQERGKFLATTSPAGSTTVTVTTGGTVVTNAFAGGTMNAEEILLIGNIDAMTYRIISNTGVTGVGDITVVLDPNTPLIDDHAIADYVTLIPNAYSNLIVAPSNSGLTGAVVGIASTFIPNDAINIQYTWIQTSGDTTVKGENVTFVIGEGAYLVNGGTTDGHVDLFTGTVGGVTPTEMAQNLLIGTVAGGTFIVGSLGEGLPIRMSNAVICA
jgi:hypothetical protein